MTFWSGVYGTCLGFTLNFEDPKSMPGLHGILIGAGEIVSGLIFGIFGKVTNRIGRFPVVTLGTILQFIAFVLIILNIPNDAYKGGTYDAALGFDPPSEALALVCSFMLGFGDACYNTQTMSLLGGVYPERAGQAFAIFKFVQCIAAAAGFMYTSYIPLYIHVGLLLGLGTIGTLLFAKIDIQTRKKEKLRKAEGFFDKNSKFNTDEEEWEMMQSIHSYSSITKEFVYIEPLH